MNNESVIENNGNKFNIGLNGTQIKLIVAFLMVFDHIHQCFVSTPYEAPMWFTFLGRLVAPTFLFLAAEGMFYTRNKKKHLLRLYIALNLMNIGNMIITSVFETERFILINNIFTTIFLGCWIIYFIDELIISLKNKNIKSIIFNILGILLPFITSLISLALMSFGMGGIYFGIISFGLLPNILMSEGGFVFVFLLAILYYLRQKKFIQVLVLILVGVFSFISYGNPVTVSNLLQNPQWMMVFASIFILLYNGEKGRGLKNLFYIFYPAHIYILYILGWFLAGGK